MTLEEKLFFLNFYIDKKAGAWFTVPELTEALDRGQMAYYSDIKAKYATSNLIKEILAPFRSTYNFTANNTISGYVVVPSNVNYLDLLDLQITYEISGVRTVYVPVAIVNEDERAARLNSQIDPVTATNPIGEIVAPGFFRIYPSGGYAGTVTFLRRPTKPVFAYTVISGRVIVFDEANSTDIEWRETEVVPVLLKALRTLGINLSDGEVSEFATAVTAGNFVGQNRL
jgi:hypothetical protein